MWVVGTEPIFLGEYPVSLTTEPSLWPFYKIGSYIIKKYPPLSPFLSLPSPLSPPPFPPPLQCWVSNARHTHTPVSFLPLRIPGPTLPCGQCLHITWCPQLSEPLVLHLHDVLQKPHWVSFCRWPSLINFSNLHPPTHTLSKLVAKLQPIINKWATLTFSF